MDELWACPYERAYMRKPVYTPNWAHMGLLSGPRLGSLWAFPYGHDRMGLIWVQYGRLHMGNSYTSHTSHTWPIYDCYLGHTRVHYWRVYMRLSALDP